MLATFGEKLQQLRLDRGLTQAALAQVSGIPVGTIRDYEQGKRDPLLSNAQRLARALCVSLDVFPVSLDPPPMKGGRARKEQPRAGGEVKKPRGRGKGK
jgi:transcriptional regulator with XRE-family HTH domain